MTMTNSKLIRRLGIWFALVLVLMLSTALMAIWSVREARDAGRWVTHTHNVIDLLNEISTAAAESEASARDYLQTGNTRRLALYEEQKKVTVTLSHELARAVNDNAVQRERIPLLHALVEQNIALLDHMLMAMGSVPGDSATRDPREADSSRLRALMAEMKTEEERLLDMRTERSSQAQGVALAAGGGALLLNIIITYVAFIRIRNEILDRLKAQQELRVANQGLSDSLKESSINASRLEKTVANIPLGVLLVDENLRIVRFNERLLELLSLPAGVIAPGDTLDAIFKHGLERGDRTAEQIAVSRRLQQELLREPASYRYDLTMSDGRLIEVYGTPVPSGGFVTLYADVTEQRSKAARLEQSRQDALDLVRAKSEFLAVMSHEIRTPMNGVLGLAELLLDTPMSPDQRNAVETILRSGENLLDILNGILDFSKVEANKLELETRPFQLSKVVGDLAMLWRAKSSSRGLEMKVETSPGIAEHLIGDAGRLRQVLSNLLGNAIKFTEKGSVTLRVEQLERTETQARLHFSVRDSGIGMTPGEQEKLFQPFSQADASTTRKFGGTGLGLAISQRLAELMGGVISVESIKGQGSTFSFTVSLAIDTRDVAHPAPQAITRRTEPRFIGRVLLVEDNAVNRAVAEATLKRYGLGVDSVHNGQEAVDKLASHSYNLVFMDMHMPVMDGLTATRRIRDREEAGGSPHVPIVAITANVLPEAREACEKAGMDDFLPKPFARQQLRELLERWLPADVTAAAPEPVPAAREAADAAQPVIDMERFGILQETMKEDLIELLDDFRGSVDVLIQKMHAAIGNVERVPLVRAAHNLGSSAATMGAARLSTLGRKLEASASSATMADLKLTLQDIEKAFADYESAAQSATIAS